MAKKEVTQETYPASLVRAQRAPAGYEPPSQAVRLAAVKAIGKPGPAAPPEAPEEPGESED